MLEIQIHIVILFRKYFTNQPFLQHLPLFFNSRNKSINDVTFWLIIYVLVLGVCVEGGYTVIIYFVMNSKNKLQMDRLTEEDQVKKD